MGSEWICVKDAQVAGTVGPAVNRGNNVCESDEECEFKSCPSSDLHLSHVQLLLPAQQLATC